MCLRGTDPVQAFVERIKVATDVGPFARDFTGTNPVSESPVVSRPSDHEQAAFDNPPHRDYIP
jgi:hypothetical protein